MHICLRLVLLLSSCAVQDESKPENATMRTPAADDARKAGSMSNQQGSGSQGADDGVRQPDFPYLAVRKTSGPALQALMTGRLEVQGDCVVFVEPRARPRLAVFHPPAALKRGADGNLLVASDIFEIAIGREVRVGGGLLPPGEDLGAALRAPVPGRCPAEAVEIGELVRG